MIQSAPFAEPPQKPTADPSAATPTAGSPDSTPSLTLPLGQVTGGSGYGRLPGQTTPLESNKAIRLSDGVEVVFWGGYRDVITGTVFWAYRSSQLIDGRRIDGNCSDEDRHDLTKFKPV